jgi:hypothetical protein
VSGVVWERKETETNVMAYAQKAKTWYTLPILAVYRRYSAGIDAVLVGFLGQCKHGGLDLAIVFSTS